MSAKEMSMDRKIINQIKALGIDMIQESGSGHPGIVLEQRRHCTRFMPNV